MRADLYRGAELVGSLEVGPHPPFSIRIAFSLSGVIVKVGDGTPDVLKPPHQVVEVYEKQITLGASDAISYRMVARFDPDERSALSPADRRSRRSPIRRP